MPRTRRIEPTRCAVQVLPCPVGSLIRFSVAAMSSSDQRLAMTPDHRQSVVRGAALMLAGPGLADAKFGMLTAAPVDRQNDLAGRLVDVGDNLVQPASAATADACAWSRSESSTRPQGLRQCPQNRVWPALVIGAFAAFRRDSHSCTRRSVRLPALFERGGDQAIVRVAGGITPLGERGFITGLL